MQDNADLLQPTRFFDHLAGAVGVVPARPSQSGAVTHRGKNDGVVELASIDHRNPDESIPKRLKNSLVNCAGEQYSQSAFTFISELFGNVRDHAKSEIPGFAALQYYPRGGKIQVVISDSGIGIVGSLQPVLEHKYQELFVGSTSRSLRLGQNSFCTFSSKVESPALMKTVEGSD